MKTILLRLILSPFVAIWGVCLLATGTVFPLPLLIIMAFFNLITLPFILLFNLSGSDVKSVLGDISVINTGHKNPIIENVLESLLIITVYLWAIPAIVFHYIKTGEIYNPQ
jgi:hypothetical protein